MSYALFQSYTMVAGAAAVWLLLLLASIVSGAPREAVTMRLREKLLILASVYLIAVLLIIERS